MKIRGYDKEGDEIKLAMTPMIDIVFQLLVFFIMTYKVTAMEGDYNIKMPLATTEQELQPDIMEDLLLVKLNSDNNRYLSSIEVTFGMQSKTWQRDAENPRAMFESLRAFVINAVAGSNADPSSATEIEAEFDSQYDLRYEETVRAIEAVSGYKDEEGKIKRLIEKIKFRDSGGGI